MIGNGIFQLALYLFVLMALAWPLGLYMARVQQGDIPGGMVWLKSIEAFVYRLTGVKSDDDMPGPAMPMPCWSSMGWAGWRSMPCSAGRPGCLSTRRASPG